MAVVRKLATLPIRIDRFPDETSVMMFARRHRLSVYDASDLELARGDDIPLATLDNEPGAAASSMGVALLGPTKE